MSQTRFFFGRIAALVALALLAAILAACSPQPAAQDEVAGELATPQAVEVTVPTPQPTLDVATDLTAPEAAATATPGGAPPRTMARDFSNAYSRVPSFEGELRITSDPGQVEAKSVTLSQWFRQPDQIRLEVLEIDGFDMEVGGTFVFDGDVLTLYDPVVNQVTRIDVPLHVATYRSLPSQSDLPAQHALRMRDLLAGLPQQATISISPEPESVAGRAAMLITATLDSEETKIESVRLWIDQATRMPLRLDTVDDGDRVLLRAEYLRFDPAAGVGDEIFSFDAPAGAQVRTVTPEDIAGMAGFQRVEVEEARQRADFDILLPEELPAGIEQRETWMGSFRDRTAVATFYGTAEETSAVLIQKPADAQVTAMEGAERVEEGGFVANVHERGEVVIVEWVEDGTHLTLVSTLERSQLLEMAQSTR